MKRRMPRRGQGFTLIEMMVVVGIVAILALLMVPAYMDRLIRNQIADALPLADIAKGPIAASWTLAHALPADNASIGLPVPEKVVSNYVRALSVEGGAVHIAFGNRANKQIRGLILTLRPAIVADAPVVPVAWVCGYAAVPGNMTAQGENRTSIPAEYLPLQCR
jgi:type IV pilus assembly protein PilA